MAIQFAPLYVLSIAASIPSAILFTFAAFNMLAHSARVIVSPAYHAVHHRLDVRANYGMFLTIWDAAFSRRAGSPSPHHRGQSQPNTPAVSNA
jgi:sterol desaturase/sphingolipid hydroxylase (fatty acid hydroxylase superfamily)